MNGILQMARAVHLRLVVWLRVSKVIILRVDLNAKRTRNADCGRVKSISV